MPCSGGPSEEDVAASNRACAKKDREDSRREVLLCSACRALESFNFDFALNPELDEWWDKHKKIDEARVAKELKEKLEREHAINLAKTKTISTLTKDEKALLKIFNLL